MSGRKISELTALTVVAEDDVLAIVDTSGTITRKVAVGDLLTTQHPSDVAWDDERVPLVGRASPGASGDNPTLTEFLTDGVSSEGVHLYSYPHTDDKWLFFSLQMSHSWLIGSEIRPHMHWSPATSAAGSVVWGLEYTMIDQDGVFGSTTTLTVTDAAVDAFVHQYAAFSAISMVSITGLSAVLAGRIYRDTAATADDYGAGAFGIEIDFHYQRDSLGSSEELTK